MAIGDAYASPAEYRANKGKADSADDIFLVRELEAVSRYLDLKLDQPYGFNKDAVATTKVYARYDTIIPIATSAGVVIKASSARPVTWADEDALTVDEDYELRPVNPREGWPYTDIFMLWNSGSVINPATYRSDEYRFQVTAVHGWPAVPEAIWMATIELTAILRTESIHATNRIQEIDQTVESSPQARSILKGLYMTYSRYGGMVVA